MKKRWWAPLILMAVLISFSRIYIGIHYPSDVVAGFASGVILGIAANVIGNKVITRWEKRKAPEEAATAAVAFAAETETSGERE